MLWHNRFGKGDRARAAEIGERGTTPSDLSPGALAIHLIATRAITAAKSNH